MQAFTVGTKTKGPQVTVWAINPAHAFHIAQHVLDVIGKNNKVMTVSQVNGHSNRWPIELTQYEVEHFGNGNSKPVPPRKGFAIEGIGGQLFIDNADTGLQISQNRTAKCTEVYLISDCRHYRTSFEMPHKYYDLRDHMPISGLPGYADFERDVRALLNELQQLNSLGPEQLKNNPQTLKLFSKTLTGNF